MILEKDVIHKHGRSLHTNNSEVHEGHFHCKTRQVVQADWSDFMVPMDKLWQRRHNETCSRELTLFSVPAVWT